MESIAFLKDMGRFLGISDSSKGTRGVTVWYLLIFTLLRFIHHFVPYFYSICILTSSLMFNTWGIFLICTIIPKSLKTCIIYLSQQEIHRISTPLVRVKELFSKLVLSFYSRKVRRNRRELSRYRRVSTRHHRTRSKVLYFVTSIELAPLSTSTCHRTPHRPRILQLELCRTSSNLSISVRTRSDHSNSIRSRSNLLCSYPPIRRPLT
jgi:hypothetical protein